MHGIPEPAHGQNAGGGGGNAGVPQEVPLVTVPLRQDHRVNDFVTARSAAIQDFLRQRAADYVARNLCRVFVLQNPEDPAHVWGYYSLTAATMARENMSNAHRRRLGSTSAPMALIGFMGRADGLEAKKYGLWLLLDAAARIATVREHIGIWGLILEAENAGLADWYCSEEIGFKRCPAAAVLNPDRPKPLLYAHLDSFLAV